MLEILILMSLPKKLIGNVWKTQQVVILLNRQIRIESYYLNV